jgi:tryptophan-rich sensory protein
VSGPGREPEEHARRQGHEEEARAYRRVLCANLVLNVGWSFIFWRLRRPWVAAAESALLTASSADLARRAGASRAARRRQLLPYPVWTAFATALTTAIARRNPRGRQHPSMRRARL